MYEDVYILYAWPIPDKLTLIARLSAYESN